MRLQNRSSDAWRELVDLYGPLVDSWCRRAGLPEAARADVGQEVFLSVHRAISGFDPTAPNATFRGWLWKITRNAALQWLRRNKQRPRGGTTAQAELLSIEDPWTDLSSDEPPSHAEDTTSLVRRALEQIRETIEPQTWEAFWQTTILGHSAPDVAEQMGLTPAAVRQAKSRTLRRLRRQLGDQ